MKFIKMNKELTFRDKIITMLKTSHQLLLVHECELNKMRHQTHLKEYEQRLINFCFDHYITKKLTKQQLC